MEEAPRSETNSGRASLHAELAGFSAAEREAYALRASQLRVELAEPCLTLAKNATIVRSRPVSNYPPVQHHAAVYDSSGEIIPHSQVLRGVEQACIVGHVPGRDIAPVEHVDEDVIYGGFVFTHFGHILLESLARLWASAPETSDTPICFQCRTDEIPAAARALFRLVGIEKAVRIVRHNTSFRSVAVPAPAFVIRHRAHRLFKQMFLTMADRALGKASFQVTEQPLYLSRTRLGSSQRTVSGEAAFEEALKRVGFHVVHPETLPIEEQIRLVNSHRYVVGPQGSAFHMLLFSRIANDSVCLTSDAPNGTYALCDALNGGRTWYVKACSRPPVFNHPRLKLWEYPELLDVGCALGELRALGLIGAVECQVSEQELTRGYRRRFLAKALDDAGRWRDASLLALADQLAAAEFVGDEEILRLRAASESVTASAGQKQP